MKNKRALFLFAAFGFLFDCGGALSAPSEPGWKLERRGFFGDSTGYISPKGIRFISPKQAFNIVSTAPKWDVVFFNTKSKLKCTQPFPIFLRMHPTSVPLGKKALEKRGTVTTCDGMPACRIRLNVDADSRSNEVPGLPNTDGTKKVHTVGALYYVSLPYALPEQAFAILSGLADSPNFGRVPLALEEQLTDGKVSRRWSTPSIKEALISPELFVVPTGYKSVSTQELVYGSGMSAQMDDLARDLGIGEKFGKK